jgi:Ca-activated chloride channel family protein
MNRNLGWMFAIGALAVALPALSALAASAEGQASDARVEEILRLGYTEAESIRLVLLPTSVADRKGKLVRGLTRDDFKLFDEQLPEPIQYFSVEDRQPVQIAFLLDVSGSMRMAGLLEEAKEAIRYFADNLHADDQLGLICFADEQVTWVTEFTADRERFLERLSVQIGYGQTAVNDAVAAAPGIVAQSTGGRTAIVLITDGMDNASRLSMPEAIELARKASVPIYTIGFSTLPKELLRKGEIQTTLQILQMYSAETGGTLFSVRDPDELKEAVAAIYEELRYQYVIGFTPSPDVKDGGFRHLRLVANKRGLAVRTRTGYYANP